MKEKFEHKITERIKEVFSSQSVEFNPQDWEGMKALLPEKETKLAVLIWTWSKVAAVILIALGGIYFFWGRTSMNEINDEKELGIIHNNNIPENIFVDTSINQITEDTTKLVIPNSASVEKKNIEKNKEPNNSSFLTQKIADLPPPNKKQEIAVNNVLLAKKTYTIVQGKEINEGVAIEAMAQNSKQKTTEELVNIATPIDSISLETEIIEQASVASMVQNNDKITDSTSAEQIQLQVEPEFILPITKTENKKVKFGVELASFTNYSEHINPTVNYGGGIAANIPIIRKFSFNPGLVFSAYNMELNDNPNFISQSEYSSLLTLGVDPVKENNATIKPTQVHLNSLDIPINFQYQFLDRKKGNYFVELGFSSLLYLSENYSYQLSYIDNSGCPPGIVCSNIATVSEESSNPAFKTFDFAKLLNFSLGLDYHLSNRFDMIFNPYLKYPVSSLTGADIKFGSGGIKLKFMIKPNK